MSLLGSTTFSSFRSGRLARLRPLRHAMLGLAVVAGVACSDDDNGGPAAPAPVDIELGQTSVTLILGISESAQLAVGVTGASDQAVTYTVANPAVATVSATGAVQALTEGSTFVTIRPAADPTRERSVVLNVVATIITTSPANGFSWLGGPSRTLTATVRNNPNTAVTWSSSNEAVATVSATGVVTPVAVGTTQIRAVSQGDPSKQAVTVFTVDAAPIADITLLSSGVAATDVGASAGQQVRFRIEVPQGASNLQVAVAGANGDLDLFVQAASVPAVSYSQTPGAPTRCAAYTVTGNESCSIANPQSRVYYILLDAYETFSGATVTATVTGG